MKITKLHRHCAAVLVVLLVSITSLAEPKPEYSLSLDPSLFEEPGGVLASWYAYGLRLVSLAEVRPSKPGATDESFSPTFREEVLARKHLLVQWRHVKKKAPETTNEYLESLQKVEDAGFLEEYVWFTGKYPEGSDSKTLDIENFRKWSTEAGLEIKSVTRASIRIVH
jgi:hypothetical protein